jgi:hypothetical protein
LEGALTMNNVRKSIEIMLLFSLIATSGSSFAQSLPKMDFSPPHVDMVDAVGISLNSGQANFTITPVGIGPKGDALSFSESYETSVINAISGQFGSIVGSTFGSAYGPGYMIVKVLGQTEQMEPVGDGINYRSKSKNGGSLTIESQSSDFIYKYTNRQGVRFEFDTGFDPLACADRAYFQNGILYEYRTLYARCATLRKVIYPGGQVLAISPTYASSIDQQKRYWTISRNDGYQLRIEAALPPKSSSSGRNNRVTKIQAFNAGVDYCADSAEACNYSFSWPEAGFTWSPDVNNFTDLMTLTVKDATGGETRFSEKLFRGNTTQAITGLVNIYRVLVGIKPPSSLNQDTRTYNYINKSFCFTVVGGVPPTQFTDCTTYRRDALVDSVFTSGGVWNYGHDWIGFLAPPQSEGFGRWKMTGSRPDGYNISGLFNAKTGYIHDVSSPNGSMKYDIDYINKPNHLLTASDSEGRTFVFEHDDRSNTTKKSQTSATGAPSLVLQADYDVVCASRAKCNKPNWIKDAKGYQTDYEYDPIHGGILKETSPPDVLGVRPQKRYSYVQRYAWLKNSTGGYSPAASPIWKLDKISYCQRGNPASAGVGCALGSTDEVVTSHEYGPDAGPNNLLLRGMVVSAGGQSLRTCYAYDVLGNKISETTPNAGLTSCP